MSQKTITENIDIAAEKAKELVRSADATARNAAAKVSEKATALEHAVLEGVEKASHAVQEAASEASHTLTEKAAAAKHAAKEQASKLGHAAQRIGKGQPKR